MECIMLIFTSAFLSCGIFLKSSKSDNKKSLSDATLFGSCIIHILNTGVLKFGIKLGTLRVNQITYSACAIDAIKNDSCSKYLYVFQVLSEPALLFLLFANSLANEFWRLFHLVCRSFAVTIFFFLCTLPLAVL
jgi:hypothetical protein